MYRVSTGRSGVGRSSRRGRRCSGCGRQKIIAQNRQKAMHMATRVTTTWLHRSLGFVAPIAIDVVTNLRTTQCATLLVVISLNGAIALLLLRCYGCCHSGKSIIAAHYASAALRPRSKWAAIPSGDRSSSVKRPSWPARNMARNRCALASRFTAPPACTAPKRRPSTVGSIVTVSARAGRSGARSCCSSPDSAGRAYTRPARARPPGGQRHDDGRPAVFWFRRPAARDVVGLRVRFFFMATHGRARGARISSRLMNQL